MRSWPDLCCNCAVIFFYHYCFVTAVINEGFIPGLPRLITAEEGQGEKLKKKKVEGKVGRRSLLFIPSVACYTCQKNGPHAADVRQGLRWVLRMGLPWKYLLHFSKCYFCTAVIIQRYSLLHSSHSVSSSRYSHVVQMIPRFFDLCSFK